MKRRHLIGIGLIGSAAAFHPFAAAQRNPPITVAARPEPVAETRLLMEALAKPNFDALGRSLAAPPAGGEAWAIARGQALLIAETGNLLLMRPPKTRDAQAAWQLHATDLRLAATRVARFAGVKDYVNARAAVAGVATQCNRCHEAFRVPVRLTPFAGEGG